MGARIEAGVQDPCPSLARIDRRGAFERREIAGGHMLLALPSGSGTSLGCDTRTFWANQQLSFAPAASTQAVPVVSTTESLLCVMST